MVPRLRFALIVLGALLVLTTASRLAFWALFQGGSDAIPWPVLLQSFYVGFKLDVRMALLLTVPFFALSSIPRLNPVRTTAARRFWAVQYATIVVLLAVLYLVDFGHYAYLETRLNASATQFLENPLISAKMVWQSYPVLLPIVGLVALGGGAFYALDRVSFEKNTAIAARRSRTFGIATLAVIACLAGLYGKVSYYPLRWSDAYFSVHRFASELALNPVLYFVDTSCTAEVKAFDVQAVRKHYDRVAQYLGVDAPDSATLSFARRIRPTRIVEGQPNVIIIFMESFAAHRTGVLGNPLRTSPNFDRIARDGVLFPRFYTPRTGTARGVFATLTGIPDTITKRTASRNPRTVKHYTIPNALSSHRKFYFLGGSASWANVRGLWAHNVEDLRIYEEGSYPRASRGDVWGISDLHLFEEANRVLRDTDEPFFAFIHLAGNHRPYTIPQDNRGFEPVFVSDEDLRENGFESLTQFNSLRFMDHSIGFFMGVARKEPYFANTLFVFLSDNGVPGRIPGPFKIHEPFDLGQYHSPFLLYGQGLARKGEVVDVPATQMDVMPTIAGAIGADVLNTTMGRNLLDESISEHYAFIQTHRGVAVEIGLLNERFYATVDALGQDLHLHALDSDTPTENVAEQHPEYVRKVRGLALGLYHTSKYMMYHNRPR